MPCNRSQRNPRLEAVPSPSPSSQCCERISPIQTRSSLKSPSPTLAALSPIAITGGSRTISITIGRYTSAADSTTEEQYQILSERLPPSDLASELQVIAKIHDESWSLESLHLLGQELNRLQEAVDVRRWRKMTVILPTVDLLSDTSSQIVVALPHLKSLTWTGHRQQLSQWSFFNQPSCLSSVSSLRRLTSLTLHSEFSVEDCSFLLSHATSVTHFEVHTLADVDSVLPTVPLGVLQDGRTMTHLETLIISSSRSSSIGPMLNHFNFPKLRKIAFNFSRNKPNFDTDYTTINWPNLQEVRLQCDMSAAASIRIRQRCGYGTNHTHDAIQTLASFSDSTAEPAEPSPHLRSWSELMRDLPFIAGTIGIDCGDFPSVPASRTVQPGHGSAVVSLVGVS